MQLETLETPETVEDLESKAGPSGRRDARLVVSSSQAGGARRARKRGWRGSAFSASLAEYKG